MLANKVGVDFSQRPAAKNLSVSASLGSLKMSGRSNGEGETPVIVSTKHDKGVSYIHVHVLVLQYIG